MSNPKPTFLEVWPLAADATRIWLLSGSGPWYSSLPVMSDEDENANARETLWANGALDTPQLLHSTSWRPNGNKLLLTYVAVIDVRGLVLDAWPDAKPVSLELAEAVGPTLPYHPADAPTPRDIDVLLHSIRHLRFLLDNDTGCAAALNKDWRAHLSRLRPALAGMYRTSES